MKRLEKSLEKEKRKSQELQKELNKFPVKQENKETSDNAGEIENSEGQMRMTTQSQEENNIRKIMKI